MRLFIFITLELFNDFLLKFYFNLTIFKLKGMCALLKILLSKFFAFYNLLGMQKKFSESCAL